MNYNDFEGKKFYDEISILLNFLKLLCMCFFLMGSVGFLPVVVINSIINKEPILGILLFFSLSFISLAMIFIFLSISRILEDKKTLKDTKEIRDKLFISELPVGVDLADYFKQREIDLLEAETKGNIDLMKKQYLRGE